MSARTSPMHRPPTAYVPFSTGRSMAIDVIRNELTTLTVDVMAYLVGLEPEMFLEQLDRWARSIGLSYGVSVDHKAGTISVAGEGVVASRATQP